MIGTEDVIGFLLLLQAAKIEAPAPIATATAAILRISIYSS
jgi:hypothetical protein